MIFPLAMKTSDIRPTPMTVPATIKRGERWFLKAQYTAEEGFSRQSRCQEFM